MTSKETKRKPSDFKNEELVENRYLILHNDDVHTFDYVIDSLIQICEHAYEQAVQYTFLVHYKGKYDVKKGGFEILKPIKDALIKRKLNTTID